MNENNQQHTPTTPTGSWGVITEVDGGFNGNHEQSEVMKAALEALMAMEVHLVEIGQRGNGHHKQVCKAITAIEQVEKQEPMAWLEHEWSGTGLRRLHFERPEPTVRDEVVNPIWTPLYSSPPAAQRQWVGLTDVEWMNIVNKDQAWFGQRPDEVAHEVAKLVEAKLKEKNDL